MYAVRFQQLFFTRKVQAVRRIAILYVAKGMLSTLLTTDNLYHS